MEYATGRLYVSKYFNNYSKEAASDMIENILEEFIEILKETDWLDDESKALALAKVIFFKVKFTLNINREFKLRLILN